MSTTCLLISGQVKLSRDEAAALAEQLAAISLQPPPPTPPTEPTQKDAIVGLVYNSVMELHVGPESAPLSHDDCPVVVPWPRVDHESSCCLFQSPYIDLPKPQILSCADYIMQCESHARLCAGHWERPARTAELHKLVTEQGLAARCWTLPPRQVRPSQRQRCRSCTVTVSSLSCQQSNSRSAWRHRHARS